MNRRFFFWYATVMALVLNACSEPITGESSDIIFENQTCESLLTSGLTFVLPCDWEIEEGHPENAAINKIMTPTGAVFFTSSNVPAMESLVDQQDAFYYPTVGGRMIFLEEIIDGQRAIAAYFESYEVEGQTVRIKFWYRLELDGPGLRMTLRSFRLS